MWQLFSRENRQTPADQYGGDGCLHVRLEGQGHGGTRADMHVVCGSSRHVQWVSMWAVGLWDTCSGCRCGRRVHGLWAQLEDDHESGSGQWRVSVCLSALYVSYVSIIADACILSEPIQKISRGRWFLIVLSTQFDMRIMIPDDQTKGGKRETKDR